MSNNIITQCIIMLHDWINFCIQFILLTNGHDNHLIIWQAHSLQVQVGWFEVVLKAWLTISKVINCEIIRLDKVGVCLFVIVSLDHLKLLKSAVTDHPQKDTFQNSSKLPVDPMCVLDSLMPSTTIEHLNRLSPLFSLWPVDITTIQMCLHTTDI